jgi:hypothetical protein
VSPDADAGILAENYNSSGIIVFDYTAVAARPLPRGAAMIV